MSDAEDWDASFLYIVGVIVVSMAACVIAVILGWSAIFGIPQGMRVLQSSMSWNPGLEVLEVVLSAIAGWFVGFGCRNREGRWRLAIVILTGVHLVTFGFNFLIAAAIQSV